METNVLIRRRGQHMANRTSFMQNSPIDASNRTVRVAVIAVEGSLLSAIAGLTDLFWITNEALRAPPGGAATGAPDQARPFFETTIVSADGASPPTAQGRRIPVDCAFDQLGPCDIALVAGMALGPDRLPPASESIQ